MKKDTITVQIKLLPENDDEAQKIYEHYQLNNKVRAFYEFAFRSLFKGVILTINKEKKCFEKNSLTEDTKGILEENLKKHLKRDQAKEYFPLLTDIELKNGWRSGKGQAHNNAKIYLIEYIVEEYKDAKNTLDDFIEQFDIKLEIDKDKILTRATNKEKKNKKFNEEIEEITKIFSEGNNAKIKKYIDNAFKIYKSKKQNPMMKVDDEIRKIGLTAYIPSLFDLSYLDTNNEFYISEQYLTIYSKVAGWETYPSLLKKYTKSCFATQTIGKIASHNTWKNKRKELREEIERKKNEFEEKWSNTKWFTDLKKYEEDRTLKQKELNEKSKDFFITTRVIKGLGTVSETKKLLSLWNKESKEKPINKERALEITDKYQSSNQKEIGDRLFINWLATKPDLWWDNNPEVKEAKAENNKYPVELWAKDYSFNRLQLIKASRAMMFQYINSEHPQWPVWNIKGDDATWKLEKNNNKDRIILESPFVGNINLKVQYNPEDAQRKFMEFKNVRPERFLVEYDTNNKVIFKLKDAKTRSETNFNYKPTRLTVINEKLKEKNYNTYNNSWYAYIVLEQEEEIPYRPNFGFLPKKLENQKTYLNNDDLTKFFQMSKSEKAPVYNLPQDIETAIEDGARIMSVDLGMRDDAIVSIWEISKTGENINNKSKIRYNIPEVGGYEGVHITSSVLNIPYKYSPLNKEVRDKWVAYQKRLGDYLLENEEKAKYIKDWWNTSEVKAPKLWIELFSSAIEGSLKILNERKFLRSKMKPEEVKARYEESTGLLKECTDFINLCLYKKGKFAHLGGLNLRRIQVLERLNILKRRLNTEPDLEKPDTIIHLTENFAKDFKKHLKNLRDERAKQLAALIVKEGLGINNGSKHLPVQIIVFENLKTYSQRDFRDRGENRKLSLWSHRNTVNYTTSYAKSYGILVQDIYATFSSQTCSLCGAPGKRVNQILKEYKIVKGGKLFQCSNSECERCKCNPVHADINAAQVLAKRFLSQLVYEPITLKVDISEEAPSFKIEVERRKNKYCFELRPKVIGEYTVYVDDVLDPEDLERELEKILDLLKESQSEDFENLNTDLEDAEAEVKTKVSKGKIKKKTTRKNLMHDPTKNILFGYWVEASEFHKLVQMLVNKRLKELNNSQISVR